MVANNEVPPGLAVWHSASSSVSVRDVCWHSCPRPPPCALWQQKEAASAGNQADGQRAATPLAKAAVWLEQWGVVANVKKKKKPWITWINRRSFFQNMRSKAVGRRLRPQDGRGRVRPREVTHRHQSAFAEVKGSALSAPLCGAPLISRRH